MKQIVREEILPNALAIGVPYKLFKHLNPIKIKPFYEAEKIKSQERLKEAETIAYMHGVYSASAVGLIGKHKFPDEPIHFFNFTDREQKGIDGSELTEEEKVMYRKQLIAQLQIMEKNYNREHKKKE